MAWMAVADDLTGAADLAGRLAGRGSRVWVGRDARELRDLGGSVILDTGTRFAGPSMARARVQAAWRALPEPAGLLYRYQKIDSTLRGNPGEEIEALLLATAAPWVAVLPAYPAQGRQVLGGRLLLRGRPLLSTEFARDPLSPARTERLAGLLPGAAHAHAPLAVLRRGAGALRAWLRGARRRARAISFDCADDADVRAIARACLAEGGRHFAGASALGAALAEQLEGPARVPRPRSRKPWAILVGSVSATSFAQLRAWQAAGRPWRACHVADGRAAGPARRPERLAPPWALSSLPSRDALGPWQAQARARGLDAEACAHAALDALVRRGLRLAGGLEKAAWFVTGGHTLLSFFERAGLRRFETLGQALPGVHLSRAEGPGGSALFASKPGGFGGEDVLVRFLSLAGA